MCLNDIVCVLMSQEFLNQYTIIVRTITVTQIFIVLALFIAADRIDIMYLLSTIFFTIPTIY